MAFLSTVEFIEEKFEDQYFKLGIKGNRRLKHLVQLRDEGKYYGIKQEWRKSPINNVF